MSPRNDQGSGLDIARALMQKERLRMIGFIKEGKKNISEIADETRLDRATVSYHLSVLEGLGLVSSEYQMLKAPHSKGKIGRYYKVNKSALKRAFQAIEGLKDEMGSLTP